MENSFENPILDPYRHHIWHGDLDCDGADRYQLYLSHRGLPVFY